MDFRQLHYVLQIAEERSISKAANSLFIAQPSLSNFLSRLEDQLGVLLFDRTTSPLNITFEGERFIQMANSILELRDGFTHEIQDIKNLNKGQLTVGITKSRGSSLLPLLLPIYKKKFPGIKVVVKEGTSEELEELTVKGKTDITIMNTPIKSSHITYEPILKEEIVIAVPPGHYLNMPTHGELNDLVTLPSVSLNDLRDERFILLTPGQRLRQIADDFFNKAGFVPQIEFETANIETALNLVSAGMGITFFPRTLALFHQFSNFPNCVSLVEGITSWTLVVASKEGRYLSRAAHEFITIMKETIGAENKELV